jgi:hypothetical protein
MKKFFLLTLLSVFFLSAFCQSAHNTPELIAKFNIEKHVDDDEALRIPIWLWSYWREVRVIFVPGGYQIECLGVGTKPCFVLISEYLYIRGVDTQVIERSYEYLVSESNKQIAEGVYRGTLSDKIAFIDPQTNMQAYLLLQINWDHDPLKPYNGRAEFTIYKTNSLTY